MKSLYEELKEKKEKMSIIGLGYVGLPVAVEFSKHFNVIGFDISESKLEAYRNGIDVTNEVGNEVISETKIHFTSNEADLKQAKFHIVSVPTPINGDKTPDLTPIKSASKQIGRNLQKGSIVVYESTVYPGTTEEICVPILEEESGLIYGKDFKVGYSPERINPGDKVNTLTKITKVVSGSDEQALSEVANVYGHIIEAGIFKAESVKVAEAAKVIENAQRDINIAFMNELSMVFNEMNISTKSVIEAAKTKWNFLPFTPGLVGGHCIGVDPYYFTYKAEQLGYQSKIILAGRKINEEMSKFVAENTIKTMLHAGHDLTRARIGIFGITFKENVPDIRNSKVAEIVKELNTYNIEPLVTDAYASDREVQAEFNIELVSQSEMIDLDAIIYAVPHRDYREEFDLITLKELYRTDMPVLIDIKSTFDKKEAEDKGYSYWSM